jgi:hypothetical protein
VRAIVLAIGVAGTLLFGAAFALTFASPLTIERAAREMLRLEVERRVGDKVDAMTDSRIADAARKALGKTDAEYEKTRQEIRDGIPKRVANAIADFMKADCECRKKLVERREKEASEKLSTLGALRDRLGRLVDSSYATVRDELLREARIFTAVNAAAFALLACMAWVRPATTRQLLLPAIVLVAAAAVTAYLYLFNQNWLQTILFGRYVGLAYIAYFGVAAVFFADILMNKARLTAKLLSSVGPGGGASPC